jgi:hypothetical protein
MQGRVTSFPGRRLGSLATLHINLNLETAKFDIERSCERLAV